jgi:pimeloyl-ACP methyl ester carboxylesterase
LYDGGEGPYQVSTEEIILNGASVTFYIPEGLVDIPVAIWSPGFARSPDNHIDAAARMASWGILVATWPLSTFSDHEANGMAIVEEYLPATQSRYTSLLSNQVILIGHSAGGLASILGAAKVDAITPVAAIIGLDLTDVNDIGESAGAAVQAPALLLAGEPSLCNSDGSGRDLAGTLAGEVWLLEVLGANHCDFESNTDWLCTLSCGTEDINRQEIIQQYAIAWALEKTVGGASDWVYGPQAEQDRSLGMIDW